MAAEAHIDADVCVVGAGYAGLTAAVRLRGHGLSVAVLEARPRVGGRIWTERLADGTAVDRGGAWLGPRHEAMFGLAEEFGVGTYKTYVAGKHLLVDGERIRRYSGLIPKISPLAIASIAWTQAKLNRAARLVPVVTPWTAPHAARDDAVTVADWFERAWLSGGIGRDLFDMAVRGLFTGPLDETSYLHLLFLVRSHGSIETLFSIDNGAQENLMDGGAAVIAERMAADLGEVVHLGTPVRAVRQLGDRVEVESDAVTVSARRAVVSIPPALVGDLDFSPGLPSDRAELYRRAVAGQETKTLVLYDEPFWRDAGLSGQSAHPGSPSEVTIDASPADGRPGVLASFTFGHVAASVDALDPAERRAAVLAELVRRFGDQAASPEAYVETPWWTEPWTRGCSMAHFGPGLLTSSGHLLREPMGLVHWAGTETSTMSHGAMDGAVRSGERAAAEIVQAL